MPRSTDVFPCTMPATTANLKSSSTFFPRCVVSSPFPKQGDKPWSQPCSRVRTSTLQTSTASPPCSPPSGKATPLVSSSSLKKYFAKFLVEKTFCLAPYWVKLLATCICPAVQLYNQIVGKRYSLSACYQAIVPVIHLVFRARPSQELPLMVLHTWRRRRRRRSKPCSDNPESAKTCDIIGQNTVLLYTTTTKLDFFLRQNLIQQEFFDLIWSHFMAECSIFLHLSSVYPDISRFVEQLWGHFFIYRLCLE